MTLGWFNRDPAFDVTGCHDGQSHRFAISGWRQRVGRVTERQYEATEITCTRCLATVQRGHK